MITGFPDIREVPCTLLTWIDGVLFSQEDSRATTLVRRLGALNAQLHAHARVWIPPQPFLRLSYDAALLHDALAKMEHGIRLGVITREDAQNVFEAGSYILRLLAVSERRPDTWGLIHADLLSDNVLVQGETLIPIDFSLSGFGYYWLDLGICLGNLKQHLRQGYLEGYGMPITNDQRHVIEACTIMIIVVSAMRHVTNAGWHAWFQRRFPVIAQHYCPMLLRKQEFIFDI
jgi:Ser/Thr protein kinase RdoA (MazF antagonist)